MPERSEVRLLCGDITEAIPPFTIDKGFDIGASQIRQIVIYFCLIQGRPQT